MTDVALSRPDAPVPWPAPWLAAPWRAALWLTALAIGLAGCADAPAAPPVAEAASRQPKPAPPAGIVLAPQPGAPGSVALANDPSAPLDAPACGTAAREAVTVAQAVLPRQNASAGVCSSFACYDPATATYLGLDGYRHVCR